MHQIPADAGEVDLSKRVSQISSPRNPPKTSERGSGGIAPFRPNLPGSLRTKLAKAKARGGFCAAQGRKGAEVGMQKLDLLCGLMVHGYPVNPVNSRGRGTSIGKF